MNADERGLKTTADTIQSIQPSTNTMSKRYHTDIQELVICVYLRLSAALF